MENISSRNVVFSVSIEGNGIPFLWSHGLISSRQYEDESKLFNWDILKRAFKVVRYDARGHGLSTYTTQVEDYTWNNLALDLVALSEKLSFTEFWVGGSSMGCAIAIIASLLIPERVKGLILATPPTAWEARKEQVRVYMDLAQKVDNAGIKNIIDNIRNRPMVPIFEEGLPSIRQITERSVSMIDPSALKAIYLGAAESDLPDRKIFSNINVPCLILAWTNDNGHPVRVAELLHQAIKGSELKIESQIKDVMQWPEVVNQFMLRNLS